MKNSGILRTHLLYLLNGDGAHAGFDSAANNIPVELRGQRPTRTEHSPWEVLEHMRIAQWDILEYIKDAKHSSPEFPVGYWPKTSAPQDERAWDAAVDAFRKDFRNIVKIVSNPDIDLLAPLHGDTEQTIFRKVAMLADHTSYHLGELVLLRRLLGAWSLQ
jgi:hypothetical protein